MWDLFTLLGFSVVHFFLMQNIMLLYEYTTVWLPIILLIESWVFWILTIINKAVINSYASFLFLFFSHHTIYSNLIIEKTFFPPFDVLASLLKIRWLCTSGFISGWMRYLLYMWVHWTQGTDSCFFFQEVF